MAWQVERLNPLENDCENANTHTHGGVHLVVLAHLQRQENGMSIFYCAGCKFLWLAHWSKGKEVRSENELIAKTLASVN